MSGANKTTSAGSVSAPERLIVRRLWEVILEHLVRSIMAFIPIAVLVALVSALLLGNLDAMLNRLTPE